MKVKHIIVNLLIITVMIVQADACANKTELYLMKPSGKYTVGFQNFHWVNTDICPDQNYKTKNRNDFTTRNDNYCHEIMARIYYPSVEVAKSSSPYYKPLVLDMQNDLAKIPGVTKQHLFQLNELKSFSSENLGIVSGAKFPVIFFSPGFGSPVEIYENIILELVSHGYVVVGINTTFISGDVELPNGHTIKFNPNASLKELVEAPKHDFTYVYNKLHALSNSAPLFAAMDFQHIGLLGQSLGGEIVANLAHSYPDWFKAAATLDSGIDKYDDTLKEFSIPFMRQISASRSLEYPSIPVDFRLEKNGFMAVISPNVHDHHFSYHMNFTDFSTLQYLPAEKISIAYGNQNKTKPLYGTGNGFEITRAINLYLLHFYNTYLKGDVSRELGKCDSLAANTIIRCG